MMALFFDGAEQESLELRRHYAVVAQACGATYIDASAIVRASDADGVHLDIDGHRKLGRAIAVAIAAADRAGP
jgi:lysophospholipase L1-like esterase